MCTSNVARCICVVAVAILSVWLRVCVIEFEICGNGECACIPCGVYEIAKLCGCVCGVPVYV